MVIQPMSISDQIIAVINDLCQKFGIAIDWTAENVLPYIEDLCARYIQFEIQTSNHFGTKINGRVYDITGDVTFKYEWKPWSEVDDELLRARIIRDCIMF